MTMGRGKIGEGILISPSLAKRNSLYLERKTNFLFPELNVEFPDLSAHADPGLPEVEDAKKRLAGLKG
jgi:hypothetical protein